MRTARWHRRRLDDTHQLPSSLSPPNPLPERGYVLAGTARITRDRTGDHRVLRFFRDRHEIRNIAILHDDSRLLHISLTSREDRQRRNPHHSLRLSVHTISYREVFDMATAERIDPPHSVDIVSGSGDICEREIKMRRSQHLDTAPQRSLSEYERENLRVHTLHVA